MYVPVAGLVPCPNHPDVTLGLEPCATCGLQYCDYCLVRLGGALTCASCKTGRVSDLRSGAEERALASVGDRFMAQLVDGLLFIIPVVVLMVVASPAKRRGETPEFQAAIFLWYAVLIAAGVAYEAVMLTVRGQTLGKMAVGIKVVNGVDGAAITAGQAWGRAISRTLINFVWLGIVDIAFIFSVRRQTLHDRVAKTVVVKLGGG